MHSLFCLLKQSFGKSAAEFFAELAQSLMQD
ncbi:MAG: hypothetical protein RL441_721 [Actinomycetota bacterium]|jgi:hypothetical protein